MPGTDDHRSRYDTAVRARRAELTARRELLGGGHRGELRAHLARSRLACSAELAVALADLEREARTHIDAADRAARQRVPLLVAGGLRHVEDELGDRLLATALPPLRRIAAERGLPLDVVAPGPRPGTAPRRLPVPDPPVGAARALLMAGATGGVGVWRFVLLVAVGMPMVGLPTLGGVTFLPFAVGLGVALLACAAGVQRAAADRTRLRRWTTEAVTATRAAAEAHLGGRIIDLEQCVGAALDTAVTRHRAVVEAELRALSPAPRKQEDAHALD